MIKKQVGEDKRKRDRRKCDPGKCKNVLIERRKADSERRRADEEERKKYEAEVIRKYHEDYANDLRTGMKELVRKAINAAGEKHPVWNKYEKGDKDK